MHCDAILRLFARERHAEIRADGLFRCASATHVEPYHGRLLPFLFKIHYLQSFEKVASSLEISLQRIYKQRLSESSRTTQIVVLLSSVYKVPNNLGLVNVGVVVSSYFLERLYANR